VHDHCGQTCHVELAGGVSIIAAAGFDAHPVCDIYIVCGAVARHKTRSHG
jgi:hypothetical protein